MDPVKGDFLERQDEYVKKKNLKEDKLK